MGEHTARAAARSCLSVEARTRASVRQGPHHSQILAAKLRAPPRTAKKFTHHIWNQVDGQIQGKCPGKGVPCSPEHVCNRGPGVRVEDGCTNLQASSTDEVNTDAQAGCSSVRSRHLGQPSCSPKASLCQSLSSHHNTTTLSPAYHHSWPYLKDDLVTCHASWQWHARSRVC